jgi:hypothetical protein
LTGKASRNHVRKASVLSGVACSNELPDVPEDGGRINAAVRNPRFEDRLAVALDFDIACAPKSEEAICEDATTSPGEEMEDIHHIPFVT